MAGEYMGDDLVGSLARLFQENWLPREDKVDQTDGRTTHHLLCVCVCVCVCMCIANESGSWETLKNKVSLLFKDKIHYLCLAGDLHR